MRYGPPTRDQRQISDAEYRLYVLFSLAKGEPIYAIRHKTLAGKLGKSNLSTTYRIINELQTDTVDYNESWQYKWKGLLFDKDASKFTCVFCRRNIVSDDTDYTIRVHVMEHFSTITYTNKKTLGHDIIKVLTPDEIRDRNIRNQAMYEIQQKL